MFDQARSQVSIFGGAQYIFEGARFYYMLKTNFSGRNKIWGALSPNAPRGYGSVFDIFTEEYKLNVLLGF